MEYLWELNLDTARRAEILGLPAEDADRFTYFNGLSAEGLRALLDENFASPDDQQNSSPSLAEFLDYMEGHPGVTAHGYAVETSRRDYRVSVEGLNLLRSDLPEGADWAEESFDFLEFCRFADEFDHDAERLNSWWD